MMILGPAESIGRGDRYAAVRQTGDWRGAGRMDFGDISVSLQVVTVVVGAVGILIELLLLAGPLWGNPEWQRKPWVQQINRPRRPRTRELGE